MDKVNIQNMLVICKYHGAEYIDSELGISPLAQVQNKETPSLVYAWDSKFFDFVGLKKRGF